MTDSAIDYIKGFTLTSILQISEMEGKTQTIKISSDARVGYLDFEDGELIDAETGNLRGQYAAIEILCWEDIGIQLQTLRRKERSINTPIVNILLEASRIRDERREVSASHHEDLLKAAVQQAEGHHFQEAQETLTRFLKHESRSHRGWLWYSRIMGTMASIEKSLNNAVKIAPDDPEVREEIKKFDLAGKHVGAGKVRRCPFCWSPLEVDAYQCRYCNAHLLLHADFFASVRGANREVLQKAMERYLKVIAKEENVHAHFYLGMAHLNLEHWEETLNCLHRSVKLAPEKHFYSNQLQILLNRMASSEAGNRQEVSADLQHAAPAASPETGVKKNKILVVEDSPTTRKVITITLKQHGYSTMEATDGLEAFSRLNEQKPDLILLDLILPKMDGYKILSIIKSNPEFKDIPVIMLTSKDGFLNKMKGKMAGSAAYLTKPFEPKKLMETIERFL